MKRDDILRMAREVECSETLGADAFMFTLEELERVFQSAYAAGAAAERAACAQVVDDFGDEWMCDSHELAKIIRARGQQ